VRILTFFIISLILSLYLFVPLASAKLGVGVGLGKINIEETLNPGGIYNLPSLPVLNTGDEDADYEVEVTFLSDQEELTPESDWFSFTPQSFALEDGQSQLVEVVLTLPVDAKSGDYFAFLEAHPVTGGEGVTIGIAAATKLNFSVEPSNILGAVIERVRSLFEQSKPASYIVLGIAAGVIVILVGRRYVDVNVGLRKGRGKKEKDSEKGEDN